MFRSRRLLGFAIVFSVALVLNVLFAGQPNSPTTSKPQPKKAPTELEGITVTLSQKQAPTEETIRKALGKPVDVEFKKMPLSDAIDFLQKSSGVNFVIDEHALREEGVATDEPIIREAKATAVARVLDRILEPLGLTWIIQDDVVQVTTIIAAQEKFTTRVYPVGDLVKYEKKQELEQMEPIQYNGLYPVQFGGGGFGGAAMPTGASGCLPHQPDSDWLIDTLQQMTAGPWVDLDGNGGSISFANNTLVIRQTQKMQEECRQIIDTIRKFTKGNLSPNPTEIRPSHYSTEEDAVVEKALTKVLSVKAKDVPLNKFLADIAKTIDVPLYLDAQALADEGVAVDEPINRDLKDLPARSVLHIALEPLGMMAIVEDGQLFATMIIAAEERLTTKIHDIRDLVEVGYSETEIIDTLQNETSGPWIDVDGTGGNPDSPLLGLLAIRQTYKVHQEVEAILANLRKKKSALPKIEQNKEPADPKAVTTKFYRLNDLGDADAIRKAVLEMVEPDSWRENQPNAEGRIALIGSTLVVKTRNEVQDKIRGFLKQYENNISSFTHGDGFETPPSMRGASGFFRVAPENRDSDSLKTN